MAPLASPYGAIDKSKVVATGAAASIDGLQNCCVQDMRAGLYESQQLICLSDEAEEVTNWRSR